jgi:internalin A
MPLSLGGKVLFAVTLSCAAALGGEAGGAPATAPAAPAPSPYTHPAGWKRLLITMTSPEDSVRAVGIAQAFERTGARSWEGWLPEGAWLRVEIRSAGTRYSDINCQLLPYEGQENLFLKADGRELLAAGKEAGPWETVAYDFGHGCGDKEIAPLLPGMKEVKSVSLGYAPFEFMSKPEDAKAVLRRLNPRAVVFDVADQKCGFDQLAMLPNLKAMRVFIGREALPGLRALPGLVALDLSGGYVDSVEFLPGLPNLTWLDLEGTVKDVAPVAALRNLRGLSLDGCGEADDWGILKGMSKLEALSWLTGAGSPGKPGRLAVLENLPELTGLTAFLPDLPADGGALRKMKKLSVLRASLPDETLKALGEAGVLANLRYLGLWSGGEKLSGIKGLGNVRTFEKIMAGGLKTDWFKELPALERLKLQFLRDAEFQELAALGALRNLTSLELSTVQITGLEPLKESTRLRLLRVEGSQLKDGRLPDGLGGLERLELGSGGLERIEGLRGSDKLESLVIESGATKLTDIKFLANVRGLRHLRLAGLAVENLDALAPLGKLEVLELCDCPKLRSLDALRSTGDLRVLSLRYQCPLVTAVDALSGLGKLEIVNLAGTSVTNLQPLVGLKSIKRLGLPLKVKGCDPRPFWKTHPGCRTSTD